MLVPTPKFAAACTYILSFTSTTMKTQATDHPTLWQQSHLLLSQDQKKNIQIIEENRSKSSNDLNDVEAVNDKKMKKRMKLSQPCGPKNTRILRLLSSFLCLLITWGILYTILKNEVAPDGRLLRLLLLLAGAYLVGDIFKVFSIPRLLGMLLYGIFMKNVGLFFNPGESQVYGEVVSTTRQIALTCILITAGLELDGKKLRQLSIVVLELSFIPCIFEAIGVAVCCYFVLGMSWLWGLLIGFTMGAVSPAIVVPALLRLQKLGYDEDNKISTIVIAAASFDDIVAISGYGVFYGMIFNEGNIVQKLIHGPVEAVIGLACGILWGILSVWIPHKTDKHVVCKRVVMIGGGGVFFVLGSRLIGYDGAGPLTCITAAFVACSGWKWQGWSSTYNPVAEVFSSLWLILQPALFGLIGTEINLSVLKVAQVIKGTIVIAGGLVARAIACTCVLFTAEVNLNEIIFINVAWIPKATVQAALGPLALDHASSVSPTDPENIEHGEFCLIVAVLSILITAPLGAIGISCLGTLLLDKNKTNSLQSAEIA